MKAIVVFLSLLAGAFAFSDCNCSFDYDPVCGSNGKTYTNMCEFKCAQKKRPGMSLVGHMECENIIMERASCICTMEYNPVCGSDGKTYGNPCTFRCAQRDNSELTMVGRDVCASLQYNQQDACICTREYNPVCGSDGLSYGNPCMLRCAMSQKPGLRFVKYGACEDNTPAYVDPCVCTREFNPVCGSDGLTYGNPCMLRCAMSQKPGLKFVQYGECGRHFLLDLFAAPSCACNKMLRPVCGSDGKTYANPCLLNCAKKQNPALKLVKQGACGTSFLQREAQPLCACNRMFEPVCGSDRITYNNLCLFECAQKQKPELTLLKKGHCYNFLLEKENDDCVCSSVRKPVCGNDLKTYDNLCQFECAAKKKPGLKVMYPMVCIIM